ncbi:hypothetical protein Pmani_023832 [Petrolisthes manimaculis]|uniref:Uncharacterized protein n=1 Tax=Petrolisthes manimaculis TaxID=1843537 RepID=A0AAE1P995_9EUCA|nr:hypothetical protein Pmani_023832 [Petrolisthes manimaculis]
MKLVILICLAITACTVYGFEGRPFAADPFTRPPEPPRPTHTPYPGIVSPFTTPSFVRPPKPTPPTHTPYPGNVSEHREDQGDGNFKYSFETENGIKVTVVGKPGTEGQSNMQGSYSYPLPDGTVVQVTYVADENGYRAETRII